MSEKNRGSNDDCFASSSNGDVPSRKVSQNESWDSEADVVVVGFGGAGAVTALEAHENGADVLILERYNGGGATAISGGVVYAGGGTDIQKKAGVEDAVEDMHNYLKMEVRDAVEPETLKAYCDQAIENFDWLKTQGVPFEASLCPIKTSYPNNKYFLYYSGNESFSPYNQQAKPAPRGHRAHKKGLSGAGFFEPLRDTAKKKGINVKYQCRVSQLITDENGSVLGVEYAQTTGFSAKVHRFISWMLIVIRYLTVFTPVVVNWFKSLSTIIENKCGKTYTVKARKGVVMAAGGFFFNPKMLSHYASEYTKGAPLGTIGDDGVGIRMGQSVGGAITKMDSISKWRFINPPEGFIRGVLVDKKGERIGNEMLYGAQTGDNLFANDRGGKAWLIFDKNIKKRVIKQSLKFGDLLWFQHMTGFLYVYMERKKASTLEQLAKKYNISEDKFLQTIEEYNQLAKSRDTDPAGKPKDFFSPIDTPPFYAMNCSYDSMLVPCPALTMGGLVVNEKTGQVKREDGTIVEGLYAAGRSAAGIPANGYVSGLSLGDCVFAGRRAGKHITTGKEAY